MKNISLLKYFLLAEVNFLISFSLHKFTFVKAVEDLPSIAKNYFASSNHSYNYMMVASRKVSHVILYCRIVFLSVYLYQY